MSAAAADDSVTIVALTGEGDFYSSGNDLSTFLTVEDPQKAITESHIILKAMIHRFCTFPKLLICVVNGPCIGIAATTAILCDIIYAVDSVIYIIILSILTDALTPTFLTLSFSSKNGLGLFLDSIFIAWSMR